MPVSEDEFERPVQTGPNSAPLSKAEQRKNNKPIMEKRRRARINHCLNELKTLILDAMKKDPARHSKLEKADILEMTVKHLQQIQRQQLATAVATDPNVIMRFKSGFDECAAEVSRYISRLEGIDSGVKQRLTAHLHRCVSGLQQVSAFPHQNIFATLAQNCDKSSIVLPTVPAVPGDVNNNSNQNGERIQIPSGLHLIPSRLPTGELALLVPNSSHISTFLNAPPGATFQFPPNTTVGFNSVLGSPLGGSLGSNLNHASAFTAVSKNQDYPSPTSTADIIKKEPNLSEKEDLMSSAYLNHSTESTYHQSYHFNVTENKDPQTQDSNYKNSKVITSGQDANDPSYRKHGFGAKFYEGVDYEAKISQKATSTSFQRNVADSTTSCIQSKDEDLHETGFKPFQVDIPNSHLKAHISIPKNQEEEKSPPTLQIHQKPNPNFVLNPNKSYQKSPHLSTKAFSQDEFSKIKSSSEEGKTFTTLQSGCFSPSSSSTTDLTERNGKRPLSNGSPEMSSTTSCGEPFPKIPRISLDVALAENQQSNNEQTIRKDRCKRISVIVEDSSKTAGRDNSNEIEIPVSASTQKDMWRPW